METLKGTLFTDWNFMRMLRLVMGLLIAYQAFELENGLLGLFAGLFIFQALANAGCCGAGACAVPRNHSSPKTDDIEFEEINGK